MLVMGKRISKTFAEITDGVRQGITNKLQHRKCIIGAKSNNTSGGPRQRNLTKEKFNNHLVDIITNELQVAVTKNTQTGGTKWKND